MSGKTESSKTRTRKEAADLARARRKQAAAMETMHKAGKDWRNVSVRLTDTPGAREADALGKAWRRAQVNP
jgi:hypothetical protein